MHLRREPLTPDPSTLSPKPQTRIKTKPLTPKLLISHTPFSAIAPSPLDSPESPAAGTCGALCGSPGGKVYYVIEYNTRFLRVTKTRPLHAKSCRRAVTSAIGAIRALMIKSEATQAHLVAPRAEFNLGPYQILARYLSLPTLKIRVDVLSYVRVDMLS